jgi:phosphatidylglycerol---prolipoprotein diacylglyceryl transferase
MHPVLLTIGGHPAWTHDAFVALAVVVGLGVFLSEARRRAMWDERLVPVLVGVVVGGAIGARLAGVLDAATVDGAGALAWAWEQGGRSILGGLSGAYVGALVGKRVGGYTGRTGDLFAPAAAIGLAVGRIGCLLTEAPGRPTSLPWGVTVDPSVADTVPECPGCLTGAAMHPSFLYEIVFLLLLFVALLLLRDRIDAPGELFVVFLAAYAVFRFGVEFTRANPADLLGLTRSQVFILVLSPLLALRVVRSARRGHYDRILPAARVPVRGAA